MKNTDITKGHSFTNEVQVNFNVICALVLDGVGRHVNGTDIVTINQCGLAQRRMQLRQQLADPSGLSDCISNSTVLSLSTGAGDRILTLGGP
jgi:hypothetical protein